MMAPTFTTLKMSMIRLKIFLISYPIDYNMILKHQVPYLFLAAQTQVLLAIQTPEIVIIFRCLVQPLPLTLQLLEFIIII